MNVNCNTIIIEDYISISSQLSIDNEEVLIQGFESSNSLNIDFENTWFVSEDYNEQNWEVTNLAASEGDNSLRINSQNYGSDRNSHFFITPELNLSNMLTSNADPLMLCFDLAYAKQL